MPPTGPGQHGAARFTPLPFKADVETEERRLLIEELAFELYGAAPTRSFYEHGLWHVLYVSESETLEWFTQTFGVCDVVVFQAQPARGPDALAGVGFERVK